MSNVQITYDNCPVNGKRCFDSKKDARTQINHKGKYLGDPKTLREYNCQHCGKWHITHMDKKDYILKEKLTQRHIKNWDAFKKYLDK